MAISRTTDKKPAKKSAAKKATKAKPAAKKAVAAKAPAKKAAPIKRTTKAAAKVTATRKLSAGDKQKTGRAYKKKTNKAVDKVRKSATSKEKKSGKVMYVLKKGTQSVAKIVTTKRVRAHKAANKPAQNVVGQAGKMLSSKAHDSMRKGVTGELKRRSDIRSTLVAREGVATGVTEDLIKKRMAKVTKRTGKRVLHAKLRRKLAGKAKAA